MAVVASIWFVISLGLQAKQQQAIDQNPTVIATAEAAAKALKVTAEQTAAALLRDTQAKAELEKLQIQAKADVTNIDAAARMRYESNLAKIGEVVAMNAETTKRLQEVVSLQTENAKQISVLTSNVAVLLDHTRMIDAEQERQDREIEHLQRQSKTP
jgi:hypothetical protein